MFENIVTLILLSIICEGITAGLLEDWSFVHKKLWLRLQRCRFAWIQIGANCEYCTSAWAAVVLGIMNFSHPVTYIFWFNVIAIWRLSHYFHVCYNYVLRKAMFVGATVIKG